MPQKLSDYHVCFVANLRQGIELCVRHIAIRITCRDLSSEVLVKYHLRRHSKIV